MFVKLWQFDPTDRQEVKITTAGMVRQPATGRLGGELMPLFRDSQGDVRLERWASGAAIMPDFAERRRTAGA